MSALGVVKPLALQLSMFQSEHLAPKSPIASVFLPEHLIILRPLGVFSRGTATIVPVGTLNEFCTEFFILD
ncbi:MAG TPA: hypothetical protein VFF50_09150, partial [Candidatus Deferrimicrobiaceae bacterium]|nr:hypothetical protein [Candidatus Deferrimicrobiaceae bacterium]